jgi:glycosyltransferase involved in cell wall biosynthesis
MSDLWLTMVIPVFNGEKFLPSLINSLHKADHNDEVLFLFIDDTSTDSSRRMIKHSGLKNTKVIVNDKNIGLYATLNFAMELIMTPWTGFIFQDDMIHESYFRAMRSVTEKYRKIEFFWAEIDILDDAERMIQPGRNTGSEVIISPGTTAWLSVLQRGTIWTISGSVSRTNGLREYGFRPDLPHCADFEFLLRAIREKTFLYIEKPLTLLRIHTEQASAGNLSRLIDFRERVAIYCEQRLLHPRELTGLLFFRLGLRQILGAVRRTCVQAVRFKLKYVPRNVYVIGKCCYRIFLLAIWRPRQSADQG